MKQGNCSLAKCLAHGRSEAHERTASVSRPLSCNSTCRDSETLVSLVSAPDPTDNTNTHGVWKRSGGRGGGGVSWNFIM